MIARMTVENFKALRHVEVELAPFTVLVGPNDSGKSSFLEALYALAQSAHAPLADCFWSPWQERELVYQHGDTPVRFTARLLRPPSEHQPSRESAIDYDLALQFRHGHSCSVVEERVRHPNGEGTWLTTDLKGQSSTQAYVYNADSAGAGLVQNPRGEAIRTVASLLHLPALARWDIEELATPSRLPPERRYPIDPSGYGLSTCIAEMKLDRGGRFAALLKEFHARFPAFKDIEVKRANVRSVERTSKFEKITGGHGEGYTLFLVRKDDVEVPAALASGGTLVTLAFLTLTHLREPRKLLLVEEPENGLHPARLQEVVALLRETVQSQADCQVVLTTHSPLLLDYAAPEEVRVFLRQDDGDVSVYSVADVPDIHERLKYLMLGELVYNEGERELVEEIQRHAHPHSGGRADGPR